jgi:hypothetical protein
VLISQQFMPHLLYLLNYGFLSPILVGREAEKTPQKTSLSTPHFILQGLQTFFSVLFGREEGIKPSPAAAIVW